ncbi:1,4-dihydroxy-2-naphthoate polyprenyltransferase [Litorilinea aerophila]|uniref:1,4-dihydroxy-2-naphthoate octaprenyltransferase n=1 Tax=Litorilinea aerophila TaxID=1204385 RepID=A0A540VLU3_9CHLR|nr:1,4-dihydroxy-2-naphthoate polyprenyltransferase [Litorilinea aerophila]MCC9074888.1 1,4-dihydroxy-2-naphthoate polyprenyltransferase [Litorilinea aerophila]GIV76878.1 MAG: 1,4-dihydroxy-2-naphthoate octaprenyltransferase [Litorilinea sp.]
MNTTRTIAPHRAWLMAARPKTLPAAVGPVLVGTALAHAHDAFAAGPALAAAAGALLLQIGSNFANDYFDFFKGADPGDRLGPVRVTASGLITPAAMRVGMMVVFGLAALVGLYLIAVGGWPILAIGVLSILAAIAYTGGPFPFGYHGLGDLFVFLFFGLVAVCGTYYVQALTLRPVVVAAAVPVGLLVTAILVVNNLRDIETDRRAGKRTLAVMLGRRGTRAEYFLLLAGAYLVVLGIWLAGQGSAWVLLPWLTLPLTMPLGRNVLTAQDGPTLNATLAGTARLSLLFSLLFALGWLL